MRQYRIKELKGEFTIEASYEGTYNEGTWFRKKMVTETRWSKVGFSGMPIFTYSTSYRLKISVLKSFKSLDKAQAHIDKHILKTKPLEKGVDEPVYHQVGAIPVIDSSKLD